MSISILSVESYEYRVLDTNVEQIKDKFELLRLKHLFHRYLIYTR